jgi:hypothetical protein
MPFVLLPLHQLRTYLTFAKVFQLQGIEIVIHYADAIPKLCNEELFR